MLSKNESRSSNERRTLNAGKRAQCRAACFTINNPTIEDEQQLRTDLGSDLGGSTHGVRFLIFGRERGEKNGTPHLQGYLMLRSPRDIRTFSKLPGLSRAAIFAAKGSPQQNIDYCSKQGDIYEYGEKPKQGSRGDLDKVVNLVKSGKTMLQISEQCPIEVIKFHKGISTLISLKTLVRDWKTEVFWFYGATGTGKSKDAFEKAKAAPSFYVKDPANKWWDGYSDQEIVILDDYRPDFSTFAYLLRLFDRYPMTVEFKGGTVQFLAKTIFLTTPKTPRETWINRSDEDIAQLTRRLTKIVHYIAIQKPAVI